MVGVHTFLTVGCDIGKPYRANHCMPTYHVLEEECFELKQYVQLSQSLSYSHMGMPYVFAFNLE